MGGGAGRRWPAPGDKVGCGEGWSRCGRLAGVRSQPGKEAAGRYLGLPVDKKGIRNKDWKPSEGKMEKKCSSWQGRLIASAGRVTLIQSSLTGIPFFMMSFYGLPVGVSKRMDFFRARLLWQEEGDKRKYHLVKWTEVCRPKDMGGGLGYRTWQ